MAEEAEKKDVEEKKEEKKPEPKIDYEATAKSKGWKPKGEYEGEGWVDAEEFVKREPLFDRIKSQTKDLKRLEKTVEALASHVKQSIDAGIQKGIAELKAQKKEAIRAGDIDQVEEIDKAIEIQKQVKVDAPTKTQLAPEISEWVGKNDWFDKDEELRTFAIAFNETYLKNNPGKLDKSLEETAKAVKRAFPEKFKDKVNKQVASVESGDGTGAEDKGKKRFSTDKLNDEQRLVYNQLVKRNKIMTHDEYFKSLDEIGALAK